MYKMYIRSPKVLKKMRNALWSDCLRKGNIQPHLQVVGDRLHLQVTNTALETE